MNHIENKIKKDYLFGCIKHNGQYELYLMPVIYWILNNRKYDPTYNPREWEFVFRGNVLNVLDNKILDFLRAIAVDKLDIEHDSENMMAIPYITKYFHFFVDFDKKLFVSSFPDIETEAYLPDETWSGVFGNPLKYLPKQFESIFA